ncbi:MAG: hypothetical protein ABIO29_05540 [Sphingomicrobium sp.]
MTIRTSGRFGPDVAALSRTLDTAEATLASLGSAIDEATTRELHARIAHARRDLAELKRWTAAPNKVEIGPFWRKLAGVDLNPGTDCV